MIWISLMFGLILQRERRVGAMIAFDGVTRRGPDEDLRIILPTGVG